MVAAVIAGAGTVISSQNSQSATNAQTKSAADSIAAQQKQFDTVRSDTSAAREIGRSSLYKLADILGVNYTPDAPNAPRKRDFRVDRKPEFNIMDPMNLMGEFGKKLDPATGLPIRKEKGPKLDRGAYRQAVGQYERDMEQYRLDTDPNRPKGQDAVQMDPGYQFRLDQNNQAIDRAQSAKRITGGRAIKEAMEYGQNFASNEFGNSVGRLFTLAGFGPGAVNTSANAGTNAANQTGQYNLAAGNAAAQGYANQNNAAQGGLQNFMTLQSYNKSMPSSNTQMPSNAPYWTGGRGY